MDNIEEHRSFKPSSLIDNDDDYCSSVYNLYFHGGRLEIQRDIFGNIIDVNKGTLGLPYRLKNIEYYHY